jgi:hypothetical protein
MTDDQTEEGQGSSLSFENVRNLARSEHAKAGGEPIVDHPASNLAFEATPRTPPPPPPPTPADAQAALAATTEPGHSAPAFEAVPVSVGVAQQRLSTATVGFRPESPAGAGVSGPGGQGWNIRRHDEDSPFRGDHSAWDAPGAPRRRGSSRGILTVTVLLAILVAILGFGAFILVSGRAHATVTIATPASVGSLTAINTAATAAVTEEMEKVMLAYGATRVVSGVYGVSGHPTLVVLLAQGPNIETTSNQFFNDFASGLQTDGVTVNRSKTLAATTGGSDFVCSPATRATPPTALSLCGWDDGTTIGLVMDVSGQPVDTTLHEAEAARSAGER